MSFLTPLYIIGLTALSLPILFHLIRRTPRGRQVFSTLMFLTPSPPRLTRRSRLDQLLLLLLRAAALTLLALAFARPFLREAADLSLDNTRGRRVAILLDTSASMRRSNVWEQALERTNKVLDGLESVDDVALVSFDDNVEIHVGFEGTVGRLSQQKPELVREQLAKLTPTWAHTDLGSALAFAGETLATLETESGNTAVMQLVVVGDFQQGATLNELQTYEWPELVQVSTEVVAGARSGNAGLQVLASDEANAAGKARVRISNAADSSVDQFTLRWSGGNALADEPPSTELYVPAGHSRIVVLEQPPNQPQLDRVVLAGDDAEFDNTFFVLAVDQAQVDVAYLGSDASDDADGLRYYLELAFSETVHRRVNMLDRTQTVERLADTDEPPQLVVVVDPLDAAEAALLQDYLARGGNVLCVARNAAVGESIGNVSDHATFVPTEPRTREDDYVLLVDIDFTDPLFAPFANPRYGDFTQIHFWNYQRFDIADDAPVNMLARFDTGDAAFWRTDVGEGALYVLASGWHPDDSEFALSTKFVPLMNTLLDRARGVQHDLPSYQVNQPVPLQGTELQGRQLAPRDEPAESGASAGAFSVTKPDGTELLVAEDDAFFRDTGEPGVYTAKNADTQLRFTVNLADTESHTELMDLGRLEQLGVRLGAHRTASEELERRRQKHNTELESSQKLWRWLIAAALCVLVIETWVAGRSARKATDTPEQQE